MALDKECEKLNIKSLQPCIFQKNNESNITKIVSYKGILEWESAVYLTLLDKNLFPLVEVSNLSLTITYNTYNMISLRSYLDNMKKSNTSLLFNELFSFVNTFKSHKFVHGNLHIDNIFLKIEADNNIEFVVIDYANSYVFKNSMYQTTFPKHRRSSFLCEYERKLERGSQTQSILYWDFFTLFLSLKEFSNSKNKKFDLFENLIFNYIKPNIIIVFQQLYCNS